MNKNAVIRAILITIAAVGSAVFLYLMMANFPFQAGKTVVVHFDFVGNVNIGTTVRRSGVKIGAVSRLEINPEDQQSVFVTIRLAPGQAAREADRWAIVARGILGDVTIEVYPASIGSPEVPEGHVFTGLPMFDINRVLIESSDIIRNVTSTSSTIDSILRDNEAHIREIFENLSVITRNARHASEALPEIRDSLDSAVRTLSSSLERLSESTDGFLSETAVQTGETLESIDAAAREVTRLLENVNRRDSLLGRLQDPEVGDDFIRTLKNLEVVSGNLLRTSETIRSGIEGLMGPVP